MRGYANLIFQHSWILDNNVVTKWKNERTDEKYAMFWSSVIEFYDHKFQCLNIVNANVKYTMYIFVELFNQKNYWMIIGCQIKILIINVCCHFVVNVQHWIRTWKRTLILLLCFFQIIDTRLVVTHERKYLFSCIF